MEASPTKIGHALGYWGSLFNLLNDLEWVRKNDSKLGRRKMELKEGSEQEFELGDFFLKHCYSLFALYSNVSNGNQ
jgi:hypothetical protein